MNEMQVKCFCPSPWAKGIGELTSPRALVGYGTLGLMCSIGVSWPVSFAVTGLTLLAQKGLTKMISGGTVLRSAVFIEADHLSKLWIQGGVPPIIIPPILEILDSIKSVDCVRAKSSLTSILNYENHFNYIGISNSILIADLIRSLISLQPNEQIAFPCSWMNLKGGGHIIIGSVEKKLDGNFLVRFHNGGDGLSFHYMKYEIETGNQLYQTTLEIDDVKEENLIPFIKRICSCHEFCLNNNSSKIYKSIAILNGKILPPSSDCRLWSRMQLGMSCSGYSIKCFLRSILTAENFQEFEKRLLDLSTKQLKEGLTKGMFWDATSEHYLAYSELRSKLVRMGGEDPGMIPEVTPSMLSHCCSKVQKLFWGIFFPLDFQTACSLGGRSSDEFRRLGEHRLLQLLSAAFKRIETAETLPIGQKEYSQDQTDNLKSAQIDFLQILHLTYHSIDRSKISNKDLQELDKRFKKICLELENSKRSCTDYWGYNLDFFYESLFPYLPHDELKTVGAVRLLDAVTSLKEKKFEEARTIFKEVYLQIEETSEISLQEAKEYEYVMIQMIYADYPVTLEEIELYAAAAIIFAKLKQKISSEQNLTYLLQKSQYLNHFLKEYRTLRLDQEFSYSPWNKTIFDMYLQSICAPTQFEAEPGFDLSKLLADQF